MHRFIRHQRALPALALVSLTLAACGSGGTTSGTTLPAVISVTPVNGAKGVTADTSIVVTFSTPMDQATTQSAYQSGDLPASGVTFSWNDSSTVMTVKPTSPLVYARSDSFAAAAKSYNFSLTGVATDQQGNRLPLTNSVFSTLRDITATVPGVPALDGEIARTGNTYDGLGNGMSFRIGDTATNGGIRGFLTFDLSGIPTDLGTAPIGATLNLTRNFTQGSPYSALNPCIPSNVIVCAGPYVPMNLAPIAFGSELLIGMSSNYAAPVLHDLGAIASITSSDSLKTSVLVAVQDDLTHRVARGNRSQYRLSFPLESNKDNVSDVVSVYSGQGGSKAPFLNVEYQLP